MTAFAMRKRCDACGDTAGRIVEIGAQDTVRCVGCDRWQYNAPRVETGKAVRSVQTVHAAIRPKRRTRILMRAGGCCELCKAAGKQLHVGHIIGVDIGLKFGMTELELNDEENLTALCDECNLGMGAEPISLPLARSIVRARIAWRGSQKELIRE